MSTPAGRPVSIKGVWTLEDGRVLLCRNYGGDWELAGGRPELGESDAECLVRELWEETGLAVRVGRPLGTRAFEVRPGRWVDIVDYACSATAHDGDPARSLAVSDEHAEIGFVDVAALGTGALPDVYRHLIARAATR